MKRKSRGLASEVFIAHPFVCEELLRRGYAKKEGTIYAALDPVPEEASLCRQRKRKSQGRYARIFKIVSAMKVRITATAGCQSPARGVKKTRADGK